MNVQETLNGTIDRFLFQNNETGFSVCIIHNNSKKSVVVRGHLSHVQPGEVVTLQGSWTTHPKFGLQFEVAHCSAQIPTSIIGLKKYLSSGLIKGIGPIYAEKLVAHFKEHVLSIIDKTPERLTEVPGIGQKRIEGIITAWKEQKSISHIMLFLQEKEVSPAYATKIYKKYGANAINKVVENPYKLAEDIWGIGFAIADKIAQNLGFALDSIKRVKASILYVLTTATDSGNLYVELEDLRAKTHSLISLDESEHKRVKQALHELHEEQTIKVITHNSMHYITKTQHYFTERATAQKMKELFSHKSSFSFDVTKIYTNLRTQKYGTLELSDDQQAGIMSCLQHKITIITGGPGTGKTTLIKTLLSILDSENVQYRLAAPTGRAAKRITESTGKLAVTLHRLLEFDAHTMLFTRNTQNALKGEFFIIDEASMIDIFLAHALMKALPLHAHLVLLGDIDQLPSVSAGNVLQDMIKSNQIPYTRLAYIFRQARDSLIVINAHRVNQGEFPLSHSENAKKDFIFIKELDPLTINKHLAHIYTSILPANGISIDNTITLVPMKRGSVGTYLINQHLQKIINPHPEGRNLIYAGQKFCQNDKVMQLRNNYDNNVYNGDIGTITDINPTDQTITVQFDHSVTYSTNQLDEIMHAYAISIHKSQGSEFDATIIPLFTQHFTLLQRNLLYTALTRAKKLCILIGQPKAIAIALKPITTKRITFLNELLTHDVQCR